MDAVLALEAHAREHGAGEQYLIEHSLGPASRTPSHGPRTARTLHNEPTRSLRQGDRDHGRLCWTPAPGDHLPVRARPCVVEKIDKDSGQLAEALAGEQARIIITTLQSSLVLQKVEELPARKYGRHRGRGAFLPDWRGCQELRSYSGNRGTGTDGGRGGGRPGSSHPPKTPWRKPWRRLSQPRSGRRTCRSSRSPPLQGPHPGAVRHL